MAENKVKYYVRIDDKYVEADMKGAEGKVSSAGGKIAGVAKTAGLAIGGALVAAGGAAIKFGSEFESGMAKASTLIDTTSVDMDGLQKKILDLSNKSGIAAADLSNTMYNALSAGVQLGDDGGDMMAYLESCTKLAKSGFTDVDTAVTSTAKVLNAYKMDVSETDKIHKILMQTQNKGITTVDELGASLAQVTPTAASMGVKFEQVGAALATMTAQGTPTATATTQLNQLFAELGKQGTNANKALADATKGTKYAGKSFQDMMKDGMPLNDVLGLMDKSAKKNGKSLLDMFGSLEAGKAALAMSGENAKQYTDNLAAMGTNADVVGAAFDKVSETSAEKFNRILNELKNAAIDLFGQLAPIIDQALPLLMDLFERLGPPIGELVNKLMPVLVDLFNDILPPVTDLISDLMPVILDLMDALLPPILDLVKTILPPLIDLLDAIKPILDVIIEVAKILLKVAIEPLKNGFSTLLSVVSEVIGGIASYIKEQFGRIKEIFQNVIDFVKNVFTGNWKGAWENVKNIFKNIWDGIKGAVKLPINFIVDALNGFIKGLNKIKVPDWVPLVGGKGVNIPLIPRLKKGMDFVPGDYFPAYLDYGERVLTREENALFTAVGGLDGMATGFSAPDYGAMAAAWAKGLRDAGFVPGSGMLRATINFDGREAAIVLTPYVSQEMGFEA